MKKSKKRIYEAVGLQLAFLLIIGTMVQSSIGAEINPDTKEINKSGFEPTPKPIDKKFMINGSGDLYYFYPENTDNFVGTKWEYRWNQYGISGYITDTNISVINIYAFWAYRAQWPSLSIMSRQPFRLYFRMMLPKVFKIVNYTGEIYCSYSSEEGFHDIGISQVCRFRVSGEAEGIKRR